MPLLPFARPRIPPLPGVPLFAAAVLGTTAGAAWYAQRLAPLLGAYALLLALVGWAWLLRRLRFDEASILILVAGLGVYCCWLAGTTPTMFAMDLGNHLAYIRYVATQASLPLPGGWSVFYHPPLYYILCAFLYALAQALGGGMVFAIRLFSLPLFLAFLVYGALTLRLLIAERRCYLLSLGLLTAWPAGIMIASRIDSNVLLYAFCGASFYHLVRWHRDAAPEALDRSLIAAGLGIMTRSNALVMLGAIALTVGCHLYARRIAPRYFARRGFTWVMVFLAVACCINVSRSVYVRIAEHRAPPFIVGNAGVITRDGSMRLADNPHASFFSFDYAHYFDPPFFDPHVNVTGRQNFWTVFCKTMLFGEFSFKMRYCAAWLNALLLAFLAYAVLPVFFYSRARLAAALPCLALVLCSVAGLLYNRWAVPVASSGDFRYTYFALIPLITLFGQHLQALQAARRTALYDLGCIIALLMPAFALIVYLGQLI